MPFTLTLAMQTLFALLPVAVAAPPQSVNATLGNGVYKSSATPAGLPWNTYNYCNAPHVNAAHYAPSPDASTAHATLEHLTVIMRHHKRTPDNLYPDENALNPAAGWDCTDFLQYSFGTPGPKESEGGAAGVYHETDVPAQHPFLSQIWNGTCDAGQLSRGGLDDAVQHGKDLWAVYHGKLGFLKAVDEKTLHVRTSTETRTFQVAGGVLYGMDKSMARRPFKVHTQPDNIDSLVPNYPCPAADAIRSAYQSVPAWTDHLEQNADLQNRLAEITGVVGQGGWSSWYDHFFDTFTSRTCHGHSLPCNATGACVSEADAARVFALGDWEYNYIWNTAQNASEYVQLDFGVFFSELAATFRSLAAGTEPYAARLVVGHDGSMIRLASGLGLGAQAPGLRWPGMGSEIVFEVWKTEAGARFVRVLHEGTPVDALAWVPLDALVAKLEGLVPSDIFAKCNA